VRKIGELDGDEEVLELAVEEAIGNVFERTHVEIGATEDGRED